MFENTTAAPPDAVFGLIEAFKLDPNPGKVNLSVGAYQDENGHTPVVAAVKRAESQLLDNETTKNYLPIHGLIPFNRRVGELILGSGHAVVEESRIAVAQTPGGTGALRVAGELLRQAHEVQRIWICDPTWANHCPIYQAAGLIVERYEWLDPTQTNLDFTRLTESLDDAKPGEAILLHTVCHNPTGFDLDRDQWQSIFELIRQKNLIPIFDFAYQGFASDIDEDAWPIRFWSDSGGEALVCQSFSKNMGLYSERIGSVSAIAPSSESATALLSQIKRIIRTMYSNPPRHGAAVVNEVLTSPELCQMWLDELDAMRLRIREMRDKFVSRLDELTPEKDFSYILRQRGMFSYSGLNAAQVQQLRDQHSIYMVGSGRINIAGINSTNLDPICQAIASVL